MTCRYICYIMTPEESSFHRSVDGGRGCWLHRRHLAHREPGLPSPQPHPASLPALSQPASGQCNHLLWPIMPTTFRHTSATTSSGVLLLGGFYSPNTTELIQSDGQSRLGFSLLPGRSGHCSIEVQKQFPNQSVSTNLISDQSFNPGPHWR